MSKALHPCGTPAAYSRHLRKGEPVDDACRLANTQASARVKRSNYQRARRAAITALTHRHRDEFRTLIAKAVAEIEAGGDPSPRPDARHVQGELTRSIRAWVHSQRHPVKIKEIIDAYAFRAKEDAVRQAVLRLRQAGRLHRIGYATYWVEPSY